MKTIGHTGTDKRVSEGQSRSKVIVRGHSYNFLIFQLDPPHQRFQPSDSPRPRFLPGRIEHPHPSLYQRVHLHPLSCALRSHRKMPQLHNLPRTRGAVGAVHRVLEPKSSRGGPNVPVPGHGPLSPPPLDPVSSRDLRGQREKAGFRAV